MHSKICHLATCPSEGIFDSNSIFFCFQHFFLNKHWPSDGTGVARHTDVPTAATRTPHFAVLNTGFSLTPPSVHQCVSEVNVCNL
jgi:hypothetical protein